MRAPIALIKLAMTSGNLLSVVGFLLVLIVSVATCQDLDQNKPRTPGCDRYNSVQIPAADLPTAEDRETLASCEVRTDTGAFPAPSVDLYFGINHPADPVKARKCAYLEREGNKKTGEGGMGVGDLGGTGLLTIIYANGKGAARSFGLALKFACETAEADVRENDGRIKHLLALHQQHWTGNDFSLCDDVDRASSPEAAFSCRQLQEYFEQVARDTRLGKVTLSWSSKEKEALVELRRAAGAFFQASSENEVEVAQTGAGAALYALITQMDARAALDDAFVADLQKLERGQLPKFSTAQLKQSDAELNSIYKLRVQPIVPDADERPPSVTPEGVRTSQRAWLRYREAWVAFGKVKYPSVTADSWRTWLTQQRIEKWKNGG